MKHGKGKSKLILDCMGNIALQEINGGISFVKLIPIVGTTMTNRLDNEKLCF